MENVIRGGDEEIPHEEYDHERHYYYRERPEESIGGVYAADDGRVGGSPISGVAIDGSGASSGGVATSGDGGIGAATLDLDHLLSSK